MKKKILISVLVSIVLAFSSIICFATSTENKTTMKGLGNEITSSINETERTIDNLVDVDTLDHATQTRTTNNTNNIGNDMENAARNVGNGIENTAKDMGNDIKNTTNKAVAGVTGNYASGTTTTNGNGMSATTWIWIVLAIVAVIIIASVWYYASQRND